MDTGERLAAYLDGALDADETAALEADLARDAGLRARLDAIRAAERALGDLGDVPVPAEFSASLRSRVGQELDVVLGDELAARRARKAAPTRNWRAIGGAAAAVVAVIAGVSVLGTGGGADDADGAPTAALEPMEDEAALADEGMDATMLQPETAEAPPFQPVVVALGRTLTGSDVGQLLTEPVVNDAVDRARSVDDARAFLDQYRYGPEPTADAAEDGEMDTQTVARAAASECLDAVVDAAVDLPVLAYVEFAEDETGADVVVYVTLLPDPNNDLDRVVVWLVDADTCQVLQRQEP